MMTIHPTASFEPIIEKDIEVFAVIEGKKIYLPEKARYVMQDSRGIWFFCNRKPRISEDDWTVNKTSIACKTDRGVVRALKTEARSPWLDSCQRTIRVVSKGSGRSAEEDEIIRNQVGMRRRVAAL